MVLKPKPRLKTLADIARFMRENFPEGRDFPDREQPSAPREIPFAGLFHDPGMMPGETIDEGLNLHWADDIDRDRG